MKRTNLYKKIAAAVCLLGAFVPGVLAADGGETEVSSLDTVWVILGAMLVFWMQPGFALVEAGMTRAKNTANILMKNFVDFMAGSVLYWLLGFSLMFGVGGGFFGWNGFFFTGEGSTGLIPDNVPSECYFIFQTVFCATAATIVSGSMAERTKFSMYILYSVLISAFIYPIEGHWVWSSEGWLVQMGFHDFAGSAVVHSCGGFIALAGAIVLGPRHGKYGKDGKARAIPGHNLTLAALGVFILWLGWFGFNPGSTIGADGLDNAKAISHIMITTNMAAAVGGIAALVYTWVVYGKPSLSMVCNGVLAGLVGITASCDCVSIASSFFIGLITSVVMCISVDVIDQKLKIDDPVGAVSVHGVSGFTGIILTGIFAEPEADCSLLTQLIGELAIVAWSFGLGLILFLVINKIFGLRVTERIEEEGLDVYEHGETAYNV
jgi:Amt family ammonium transporter